ncbi:antigen 5 like allergen Cul n 1-like [Uranotaenia lowii]|uniref:antigen 5 like allergen Cul n 1-like n=1 Tax=Uranotaenia lowii TaxID=190385 RepID=UPI00247A9F33|nr:antigen 5 like allergen Cul n 1-like [Uranotaenia lowii]
MRHFIFVIFGTTLWQVSEPKLSDYCQKSLCSENERHVACNGPTKMAPACGSNAKEILMDDGKKSLILDLHNKLRSKIASGKQNYTRSKFYPQAARMATLQWDPQLAEVAAANARGCEYGHDECRNTPKYPAAGQNIAIINYYGKTYSDNELITRFINDWYSEYSDANPSIIGSYPENYKGPQIGHFTQIASDRTDRVGCAVVRYVKNPWNNVYIVCNYGLTNIIDQPVYVVGNACSQCRTGCNRQYSGLCNTNEAVSSVP